jgi:hypothetical protein
VALPETSTFPLGSNTAMWAERATLIALVGDHVPDAGSYSSALAK